MLIRLPASKVLSLLYLGLGAVCRSADANAANDQVTGGGKSIVIAAEVKERTARGALDACEITYAVAFEDFVYRQGAPTMLRGSVAIFGITDPDLT